MKTLVWKRWKNELMEKKICDYLQKWILNIELRSCVYNSKTTVNNVSKWINKRRIVWCTARTQYAAYCMLLKLIQNIKWGPDIDHSYRLDLDLESSFPKWIFTRFSVAIIVNYFVLLKITVYKPRKIIFFIWNESPPLSVTMC